MGKHRSKVSRTSSWDDVMPTPVSIRSSLGILVNWNRKTFKRERPQLHFADVHHVSHRLKSQFSSLLGHLRYHGSYGLAAAAQSQVLGGEGSSDSS